MTIKSIINSRLFLDSKTISKENISLIGGKARQLWELHKSGFEVPKWIVIPNDILDQIFLVKNNFSKDLISKQLTKVFAANKKFAVRSSASMEDGTQQSFAGQFETELNVSLSEIEKAIEKVWNSTNSELVKNYCKENNLEEKPKMAIIIQEMLEPDVAGVAFGINPVNGDRFEKVISAVYGLGEGLVSGELDADTFVVGKEVESTIVKKEWARKRTSKDGTELVAVSYHLQKTPCLNNRQIKELTTVLDQLKKQFGKAQDIEFAYVDNQLFLLQTRPVTGLDNIADQKGEHILWDNSNIVESYPGVTSPLTFSFILKIYEAAYQQLVRLLGVPENKIEEQKEVYANLLGLIKGHVYYNLVNWYRLLAQLPGFSLNAKFMENMMGVKESFDLPQTKSMGKIEAWYRVINSIFKMLWQLIRLPKNAINFHKFMDKTVQQYESIDFDQCRPEVLMQHYLDLENLLLKRWKAPLINDLFAMVFFGLLQKMSKQHFPNQANFHNELVAGSGDIISTQPAKILLSIATKIQEDKAAKILFLNNSNTTILKQLKAERFSAINQSIQEYIEIFGDRCTGELKLETITYRQNPEDLIHILKSYVKQGRKEEKKSDKTTKRSVNAIINEAFKGKWFKKKVFTFVLKKARALVSGRENLRFERTRAFGIVRELFLAIGRNWYSEGLLENPRDIFYLSQQEIFDFIKGTSINTEPAALVKLRKRIFSKVRSGRDTFRTNHD